MDPGFAEISDEKSIMVSFEVRSRYVRAQSRQNTQESKVNTGSSIAIEYTNLYSLFARIVYLLISISLLLSRYGLSFIEWMSLTS